MVEGQLHDAVEKAAAQSEVNIRKNVKREQELMDQKLHNLDNGFKESLNTMRKKIADLEALIESRDNSPPQSQRVSSPRHHVPPQVGEIMPEQNLSLPLPIEKVQRPPSSSHSRTRTPDSNGITDLKRLIEQSNRTLQD